MAKLLTTIPEQLEDARRALKTMMGNFEGLATNMRALEAFG